MTDNHPCVLVVEDNVDNRTLISDLLGMLGGTVIEAKDGVEGVELASREKPALILMDLSLPRKDGWQAVREIKASVETAHIPIIALTAHAMIGDRERALDAGCDDYVSKPIDLLELTKKIKAFLSSTEAPTG
jgi:CheY-like chemotaxis protein